MTDKKLVLSTNGGGIAAGKNFSRGGGIGERHEEG